MALSPTLSRRVILCAWLYLSGAMPLAAATPDPLDWPHWRGPELNGISRERMLPSRWSTSGENLVWRKEEYATRSTPIVINGRLYTMCRAFPETTQEGEKVVCLDPATGEPIWEAVNNVFLSDAPAERVGWSSVVGDVETGNVYALGLGCYFQCLDGQTGQRLWERSMSEEYGMLSTYGGRTNFPIVFEDLVIISGVMTGWGEYAVPAHRFVAFDKRSGEALWIFSTRLRPEDTTYATPVVTNFNGQMAIVFGAGDGTVYALQPRTGKVIWKYDASNRGINTMPLVADGIVYCGHSEQNAADTTVLGALFAFDGRTHGEVKESELRWKIPGRTVGRCQPLLVGDRLYAIDDGGTLWIVDAQTGKDIGRQKLGRIMFGSMVYGDGKIYAGEATGRFYVLEPTDRGVRVLHQTRLNNEEILGSPMIAHGRVYLPTSGALYSIGVTGQQPTADPRPDPPKEPPPSADPEIAQVQIVPVEVMLKPGETQAFEVRAYNAHGQLLRATAAEFTVEGPGAMDSTGTYVAPQNATHSAALVTAKVGDFASTARVRIIPPLPWSFDFADGQVPVTWIGAAYRHQGRPVDGNPALVKISTIPKGTRSQSWMGWTDLANCTVQVDFLATTRNNKLPDMGLINQRYTLVMMASQALQVRSWASRLELRFAKAVPFAWGADTWYTMKFRAENQDGQAILRGKVWPRGTPEPDAWTIEATDQTPNTVGSPGMFGNATDAEFYIDDVKVYANAD